MGIIEDRRRELARKEIEEVQRNKIIAQDAEKDRQSFLAAEECLKRSGFLPLLQLLVPPSTSYKVTHDGHDSGYESGSKVYPQEPFTVGDHQNHNVGLSIFVFLGSKTVLKDGYSHTRGSNFRLKFHPDGKIVIEAGPKGSTAISVSDLSQNPTLGEKVLENAYLNPYVYESKTPLVYDGATS